MRPLKAPLSAVYDFSTLPLIKIVNRVLRGDAKLSLVELYGTPWGLESQALCPKPEPHALSPEFQAAGSRLGPRGPTLGAESPNGRRL